MAERKYTYLNQKKETLELVLSSDMEDKKLQADKDYNTSFNYIQTHEYYIWREAFKSYHMSTYDRKIAIWSKKWKQNISIWLIRSFCDVLISSTNERPITFIWTWINSEWIKNKDNILKTLCYISDVTWFHTQIKKILRDWLITWEFALRIWYISTSKTEKITSIINWNYVQETEEVDQKNYPYATAVSIFNIFPDPYNWILRYVTERWVIDYNSFIEAFGHMIRSKNNESPFNNDDFLSLLPINNSEAKFDDYWNILNQIHEKINDEFREKDKFQINKDNWVWSTNTTNIDENTDVTDWLIEFKITYYKNRAVLIANWYPVYIWKNPYWFIPYVVKPANSTDARFWEWIPYMLKWIENIWNSFINNYIDSARSIADPTMVVQKNLLINDIDLQESIPWWILYTENNDNWRAVYRLDKWGLSDFNILPLLVDIATRITWISEYNLWISSKERTATWALSVTQSSEKRMSPFLSNFLDAISVVAQMWLLLVKNYRKKEQFIYVLDQEAGTQTEMTIQNTDILWKMNISLQAEWMFGSYNELEVNKLINTYNTLAGSWFINSPEFAKEIIKKSWFEPSKFITEPWQWTIPDNLKWKNPADTTNIPQLPDTWVEWLKQIMQTATNPQLDLWNWGQWNW